MSCGESLFDGGLDMHNICEFQPIGMTQVQVSRREKKLLTKMREELLE